MSTSDDAMKLNLMSSHDEEDKAGQSTDNYYIHVPIDTPSVELDYHEHNKAIVTAIFTMQ